MYSESRLMWSHFIIKLYHRLLLSFSEFIGFNFVLNINLVLVHFIDFNNEYWFLFFLSVGIDAESLRWKALLLVKIQIISIIWLKLKGNGKLDLTSNIYSKITETELNIKIP